MAQINCTNIEVEKIRARVVINDYIVETPYVKSFSINKSRTTNIGTFSCTLEIPANANIGYSSGTIEIYAGTEANYMSLRRFTGVIRQITPNPAPGKPNYMLLSISGRDIMYKLENKKFSRRIPSDGPGIFVTIEGSKSQRPSSVWASDRRVKTGQVTYTNPTPDPGRTEHNSLIKTSDYSKSTGDWMGRPSEIVPEPGGGNGSGGLNIHDHSTINLGGPAFGTYSKT